MLPLLESTFGTLLHNVTSIWQIYQPISSFLYTTPQNVCVASNIDTNTDTRSISILSVVCSSWMARSLWPMCESCHYILSVNVMNRSMHQIILYSDKTMTFTLVNKCNNLCNFLRSRIPVLQLYDAILHHPCQTHGVLTHQCVPGCDVRSSSCTKFQNYCAFRSFCMFLCRLFSSLWWFSQYSAAVDDVDPQNFVLTCLLMILNRRRWWKLTFKIWACWYTPMERKNFFPSISQICYLRLQICYPLSQICYLMSQIYYLTFQVFYLMLPIRYSILQICYPMLQIYYSVSQVCYPV